MRSCGSRVARWRTEFHVGREDLGVSSRARQSVRFGWLRIARFRVRQLLTYWQTLLMSGFGYGIFYIASVGLGIGTFISQDVEGHPYIQYVAPGLLVGSCFTTAGGYGIWTVYSGFHGDGHYHLGFAGPLAPRDLYFGELAAVGCRIFAQAVLFWLGGWFLGAWPSPASISVVLVAVLVGLSAFAPLAAYSAFAGPGDAKFAVIDRMFLLPMFLFGGVFLPIELMPRAAQWFAWLSPVWHGLQAWRLVASDQHGDAGPVVVHVLLLAALLCAGSVCACRNFARTLMR